MEKLTRKIEKRSIRPQYIKDTAGNRLVVLLQENYNADMEDMTDSLTYLQEKLKDNGERIAMNEAFRLVELNRKVA